jgi:hypothetical protein
MNANQKIRSQFSASEFTWEGNSGATNASDLGLVGNNLMVIPQKIAVKSPRTGVTKVFSFTRSQFSVSNELIGWEYRSPDGFSLMIFND